uniref:Gingipain domain-containing protein n=1 Tax=candidate division WOR-3 bacterium TaxID=2052148 RepID=A0A7C4GI10_UNCW3
MKVFAVICLAACVAFAGVVPVALAVRPDEVVLARQNGFTVVNLIPGNDNLVTVTTTEPGTPLLPVLSGNVLLPPGSELEAIELVSVEWHELGTGLVLHPVQPMRPFSQWNSVGFAAPEPAVYSSDAPFPTEALTAIPAGNKTGFRVAGFLFCPFRYHPASGRLLVATRAELAVRYCENSVPVQTLMPGQVEFGADMVARLVVNPADVSRMVPPVTAPDIANELDVAVVTSQTLKTALRDFNNYLGRKGYIAEVFTTDTIYARYPGTDNAEKVRNFLKDMFATRGLKYVILAGDVQHVPYRTGYLDYSPYNVPADLYFSDLDGTWNANGNSYFGEMTGDSVDLFADIYVGRLPLDDATHAATFLRKDTTYELHPDTSYLDNVLLPFEDLWSSIDYYGRIINKNIALALSAYSPWQVDSMLSMPPWTVVAAINSGRHMFHFAGHGAVMAFGYTFSISNLESLTNTAKPSIVNSMACDCGNFDQNDCLGERFVTVSNGGAVSTCLNARYGWGAPPNMGPSENLCMEFYNNYLKGMTQGQAYGLAKDFYRNAAFSQMTYRWSVYGWTLQGDPTMLMWRRPPQALTVVHEDTIAAVPQQFEVVVECGHAPFRGARVAVRHGSDLLGRAVTNAQGRAFVNLPALHDTWTLTVSVTGQDAAMHEATVRTRSAGIAPLVVYDYMRVDDPNGRLDPGENVDLSLVVRNVGNAQASGVTGVLRSASPYVLVTDSTSSYGTVAAGDTAVGDVYHVVVSRDCPQGHRAELTLVVSNGYSSWYSVFEPVVGLKYARGGLWAVHDTADFVLGVCANGGIGTTQWRGEGLGFIYPKTRQWSSSAMMHGGLMLGTDTVWVCDNYYGVPWRQTSLNFRMEESLRMVVPAELGEQEYRCVISDAAHPEPKGLTVTQRSYVSARLVHKDFVVIEYRIHNNSAEPLTGLYVGVACDFRTAPWNANDQYDFAGTDSVRNLAYIKSASSGETLALGVRHIYPVGMNGYANCISHNTYINDGFTKSEKMKFMDGRLRSTTGTTQGNWHALSSSGPYTIAPGDSQIVAWVICGGRTVTAMAASSDSAMEWFAPPVAVAESEQGRVVRALSIAPRVFSGRTTVSYSLSRSEPVPVVVFDAAGRVAESFTLVPQGRVGSFVWRPAQAEGGVYFMKVGDAGGKVVYVR